MKSLSGQTINIQLSGGNAGRSTGGSLYGSSETAVILSNMNTNNQIEWQPLLEPLLNGGYMVLTYDYINPQADQWDVLTDVISHIKTIGAKRIVLIGASRGGVTSFNAGAGQVRRYRRHHRSGGDFVSGRTRRNSVFHARRIKSSHHSETLHQHRARRVRGWNQANVRHDSGSKRDGLIPRRGPRHRDIFHQRRRPVDPALN